ncbi:hypothetical protein NPIL_440131 [Nephila pilipes]|uniref:Uncharacterized protein n=1 Tax=Nephila pilipes TaxID=299642 RepID=A0A8X6QZ93_NEPPI|nr:hypothetical protein NPIL_440131 [Nephila pilipes]
MPSYLELKSTVAGLLKPEEANLSILVAKSFHRFISLTSTAFFAVNSIYKLKLDLYIIRIYVKEAHEITQLLLYLSTVVKNSIKDVIRV